MEADYSLELGPAAPALELPWTDPEGRAHYVELRSEDMERNLDRIAEAQRFPALRRFLSDVNSSASAWLSAKCDVWADETDSTENLYGAGFTHSSYVDLVLAEQAKGLRDCLETHQQLAKKLAQRLEVDESLEAVGEIVVRRCYFHRETGLEESDDGYCLTVFLTGYGESPEKAAGCWEHTLEFAAECLVKLHPRDESA